MEKQIGSIWYLSGRSTKVEVIKVSKPKSECKILEVSQCSKFKVGDIILIANRLLYPRNERMPLRKIYQRKKHEVGSHWFLMGKPTEVEIVEDLPTQSRCKIIRTAKGSKYKNQIGQILLIANKNLYPYRKGAEPPSIIF